MIKRLTIFFVLGLLAIAGAEAHSWYTGLQNEKGWSCCGGSDCAPLADGDVKEVPGGYYIWSKMVFVPASRAKPAREEDGHYHACFYGDPTSDGEPHNMPRCFFYPNRGY